MCSMWHLDPYYNNHSATYVNIRDLFSYFKKHVCNGQELEQSGLKSHPQNQTGRLAPVLETFLSMCPSASLFHELVPSLIIMAQL